MTAATVISTEELLAIVGGPVVLPCEWQLVGGLSGAFEPCVEPVEWAVVWRVFCAHGMPIAPNLAGRTTLLCAHHWDWLTDWAQRRREGQLLSCSACRVELVNIEHVLDSWSKIK